MVQHLLHSICQGCCAEVLHYMPGVNGVTPVKYDDMSQFAKKRNDKKKNLKKKSLGMKNEDGDEEGFPETSRSDPEEEARTREKAALDQHHLEVYRNIHLLQDVMHRHYAALLKEKILKQRQEIRQRGLSIPKPKENPPKKVTYPFTRTSQTITETHTYKLTYTFS
ncbi:hypothetical protein AGOR_G00116960 [Albula goreensis]|uniref:Uncharacterized protein n=1 Tax=Albula goreensis TaxID=1534307 RepID=A0A8T3DED4_9TELE|nr:hypothetical protein AGOR_G00116960 [Albula goreensis]